MKNIASSITINSLPGTEGHYGPLKRPSSALWWSRSNLVVLHGQKNGPYGALLKLQMEEKDSVTSAGELQRNMFDLHIFVMCCKISAMIFTLLEWVKILSVFGDKRHQYTTCLVASCWFFVDTKEDSGKYSSFRAWDNREAYIFLLAWGLFFSFEVL